MLLLLNPRDMQHEPCHRCILWILAFDRKENENENNAGDEKIRYTGNTLCDLLPRFSPTRTHAPLFVGFRSVTESACNRLHIKCATVLNRNDLTVTSQSLYKRYMSDIISNDAAHPEWRQLCQAALFEFNPAKLLERIARARNAILDRIEDGHSKSPNSEQSALREALATLDTLRGITERQNGYQSKAS
jgi:hypothetical protein